MIVKNVFFAFLLIAVLFACKSTKNQVADSQELLVLLSEDSTPEEVSALSKIQILEKKKTSKSQNQWLLKFMMTNEEFKILKEALREDPSILEIIKENNQDANTSNSKSGRSKPKIKN